MLDTFHSIYKILFIIDKPYIKDTPLDFHRLLINRTVCSILSCLLLLPGCSYRGYKLYTGPQKEKKNVAYLQIIKKHLTLLSIDSSVNKYRFRGEAACGRSSYRNIKYEILPGVHEVKITYRCSGLKRTMDRYKSRYFTYTSNAPASLKFEARAGHSYKLFHNEDLKKKEWRIVISDTTEGTEIVRSDPLPLRFKDHGSFTKTRQKRFDKMMKEQGL
jgi:hypothetical protein